MRAAYPHLECQGIDGCLAQVSSTLLSTKAFTANMTSEVDTLSSSLGHAWEASQSGTLPSENGLAGLHSLQEVRYLSCYDM